MDMNELKGGVLKVNLARPMKGPVQPMGNRAGASIQSPRPKVTQRVIVWESEEWLKEHVKPLAQSGGTYHTCFAYLLSYKYDIGVQGRQAGHEQGSEPDEDQHNDTAMGE